MTVATTKFTSFVQGTDQSYTITASRAATASVPALDLETATAIEICATLADGSTLFTKVLDAGITVTDANTMQLAIVPDDTSGLTGNPQWDLNFSLKITEASGRISKPWRGEVTVLADPCAGA